MCQSPGERSGVKSGVLITDNVCCVCTAGLTTVAHSTHSFLFCPKVILITVNPPLWNPTLPLQAHFNFPPLTCFVCNIWHTTWPSQVTDHKALAEADEECCLSLWLSGVKLPWLYFRKVCPSGCCETAVRTVRSQFTKTRFGNPCWTCIDSVCSCYYMEYHHHPLKSIV